MPPTLKDIADRAGVSVSTVSRVINNDPARAASPKTAEKVWKIIHEMQYVPNEAARMLIHGSQRRQDEPRRAVGCILSASNDVFGDPFFAEVIAGIQEEVARQGYVMEYTFPISNESGMRDAAFFNNIVSRRVDGAVLLGRFPQELYDMLKNNIPRLVYCGLNYIDDAIPQVVCDATKGIEQAVAYLIGLGHRRIGFIGETNRDKKLVNEWRFHAFGKAMRFGGLPVEERDVLEARQSLGGCYHAVMDALDRDDHATAYFCANDITAIAAMRAIHKKGLRIPGDISLIGFDDIELCRYVSPSLTTIHTDIKDMGILSVRTLLDGITKHVPPVVANLPFHLVERESCAAAGPPPSQESGVRSYR